LGKGEVGIVKAFSEMSEVLPFKVLDIDSDIVRRSEYTQLSGTDRRFIKGQKYTLLSSRENLTSTGRANLRRLLKANKRLSTAYLLKESFEQLWNYR
jgi:hypothetical protein